VGGKCPGRGLGRGEHRGENKPLAALNSTINRWFPILSDMKIGEKAVFIIKLLNMHRCDN
jgi:hypothetical protein